MRILVVTPWFPSTASPESGLFVAREAAALAELHDVSVLHLDWTGAAADSSTPSDIDVRRVLLRRSRPSDFVRARRIVRHAAEGADVVHTHALPVLLPWLADRVWRGPWVHSEHWSGLTAPETLGRAERTVLAPLRRALARPDVVVAESERLAAAIRPHRSGEVAIVPCVVPPAAVRAWPERNGLVAVGSLIPRKGPLLAVGALATLRARGVEASLTWVGDGALRDEVAAEATHLGVRDVLTLTGTLDSDGVAAALDSARLFVLPTQGDNFCVVAAEALTHGRPIVSGSATGAVDYADPAVSRFVTEQSGEAYAEAIESLLAATSGTTPAAVAATVAGRFAPETVRGLLEDIYRAVGAS